MQDRVGEFILEIIFIQQIVNTVLDDWVLKNLVNVWSLIWVDIQHCCENIPNTLAEMLWDIGILASYDFPSQLMQTLSIKWRVQSAHLIK